MIEISEPYKTILADELALICEKMNEEAHARTKLFHYSAAYAMVQRIFNLESKSNQQLVFIYIVLAMSYNKINERINQIAAGDNVIILPEDFFVEIISHLQQLSDKIRSGEDAYAILEKIAVLAYITDGNGYYLHQKGHLSLPE